MGKQMMVRKSTLGLALLGAVFVGGRLESASAQVVRIAPIVKQTATADGAVRLSGTTPPTSDARIDPVSTFYVELWATNVGAPLDGLACVYVDMAYDRTDLMDSVPPAQDGPLFTVNAVTPVFDDAGGLVGDTGGCQPAPAINSLGVGEWVMTERIQMTAVGVGGLITLTLVDANNIFAGTAIIGQLNNVNPVDIDFQSRTFTIGECLTAADCNDGNPCTDDSCAANLCVSTPNDANNPDDGLFCNGVDICAGGFVVTGSPPNCDDSNPCTNDSCDETNDVCANVANDANNPSDGLFCNGVETCSLGVVVPGTPPNCNDVNVCTDDSCDETNDVCVNTNNDANDPDDGLFCNGVDTCVGGVVVTGSPPNCDDGNPCTDDSCDESINSCVNAPNDLNDPSDGLFCNGVETCAGGVVVAGTPPNCDDLNVCTDDVCDETNDICVNTNDNTNDPDDGLFCNGVATCLDGIVIAGTPPNCDDGSVCTDDSCDEVGDTCVNTANDLTDPSDGLFCNGLETCSGGVVVLGIPPNCDDGNLCTDDVCDETNDVCVNTQDNTNDPDDGLFCNGVDTCLGGVVVVGSPPNCGDSNVCTTDSCDETNDICVNANNTLSCDDGNPCTDTDVCAGGICAGTAIPNCDPCTIDGDCNDANPCTDDTCHPAGVCIYVDNVAPCNDGDPCTATDTCAAGACGGTPVDCSGASDDCNLGVCNAVTGVCEPIPTNEGGACDNGDPCTLSDTCSLGACQAGTPVDCTSLDNTCNVGVCNSITGVCETATANEGGACDDSDVCTESDTCVLGACVGTPIPGCETCVLASDCNDNDPCTNDSCHPAGICIFNNNTAPCDDGDACTQGDTCSVGICSGTPITGCLNCLVDIDCNDANTCTDDTCPAGACVFSDNTSPCDDGDACTGGDTCSVGVCSGTPIAGCQVCTLNTDCDDANTCTDDTCPAGVCVFTNNVAACDDGLLCTNNDVCSSGACTGTGIAGCLKCTIDTDCDDSDPCTDDTCPTGLCFYADNTATCDDGDACTENDACSIGVCAGTSIQGCQTCVDSTDCSDGNPCTIDACLANVCTFVDNSPPGQCCNPVTGVFTTIDDSDACTSDVCNADGSVTHNDNTPVGQCCNPANGLSVVIDDNDACTTDTCNADGTVTYVDSTPSDQCCDPITGLLTAINDLSACTFDVCNADGTVTHNDTTPPGRCCSPVTGNLAVIDDGDACTIDNCNPDGSVTHLDTTLAGDCCNPITGDVVPIDDSNACTADLCNVSGTVLHVDSTPLGQCCNPATGTLASVSDGDVCTTDVCNTDGSVTHTDTTSAGQCCDPFTGAQRTIDDGNTCTTDICNANGTVSHFNSAGPCNDGDLCTSNDQCSGGVCSGLPNDPLCTPALDLVPNVTLGAAGGGATCIGLSDLITIQIAMGASTPSIVGGQFFLEYDTTTLDFVSMVTGDPPFSVEIFEFVNETAGTIDYAVAVPTGDPGTTLPTTMAVVTFQAVAECDSFVRFRSNQPPTTLTDSQGFARDPVLGPPTLLNINDTAPVFTGCPVNVVRNADAGTFGANVSWEPITADDSCDGPVEVICDETNGRLYPVGSTPVLCQTVNSCGVVGTCSFDVVVRPFSDMNVAVQLSPTIATSPLTRCITFELWQCGFVAETVEVEIEFFNGLALEVPIVVPAGFYECVTARDRLHTLRATAADFSDDGQSFSASFVGDIRFGGHGLTGGNLNDDEFIDIVDFAVYNSNIGISFPNTPCAIQPPHADINADGIVNAFDFTFIQQNFLKGHQPNCCGQSGVAYEGEGPLTEITISELRARGLGHLAGADLNHDGVIDVADMAAMFESTPPSRKRIRDARQLDIIKPERDRR